MCCGEWNHHSCPFSIHCRVMTPDYYVLVKESRLHMFPLEREKGWADFCTSGIPIASRMSYESIWWGSNALQMWLAMLHDYDSPWHISRLFCHCTKIILQHTRRFHNQSVHFSPNKIWLILPQTWLILLEIWLILPEIWLISPEKWLISPEIWLILPEICLKKIPWSEKSKKKIFLQDN